MYTRRTSRNGTFKSLSSSIRCRDAKSKIAAGAFLLCVACIQSALAEKNYTFVKTKYGEVRGQLLGTFNDIHYQQVAAYLGIPFAKPPVGELRFLKPQPPEEWNTTLEADEMPPACVQHSEYPFPWYDSEPGQSEDCLYLNIWAPFNSSHPRAVKVYIHGGGFSSGSNRMGYYGGQDDAFDFFSDSDYDNPQNIRGFMGIVDVVINYRLGALGFLTSGTGDAPGNVGLYDMVMALQWVRENIAAFGGDPNKIALVGQGAGAVAISLFIISPLTKDLFRRAILTGGSFLTIRKNKLEDNLKLSQRLATAVGCNSTSLQDEPEKTVQCLRNVNASRLAKELSSFNPTSHYSFYPQYEQDDLIPIEPLVLLEYGYLGNIEIFIGYTKDEGSYLLTTLRPDVFGVFGEKDIPLNGTFARAILTEYLKVKEYPDPESIADRLLNGTDSEATNRNRELVYNAMGDENVVCPIVYFSEKYGDRTGSVFLFEIAVDVPYNPWAEWMGNVHFNNVQLQFFYGALFMNSSRSYEISKNQKSQSFYIKVEQASFITDGHLLRDRFSSKRPRYAFMYTSDTDNQEMKDKGKSNPSQYNCAVFRPYHELQ